MRFQVQVNYISHLVEDKAFSLLDALYIVDEIKKIEAVAIRDKVKYIPVKTTVPSPLGAFHKTKNAGILGNMPKLRCCWNDNIADIAATTKGVRFLRCAKTFRTIERIGRGKQAIAYPSSELLLRVSYVRDEHI